MRENQLDVIWHANARHHAEQFLLSHPANFGYVSGQQSSNRQ
jgi:hypothetical protein